MASHSDTQMGARDLPERLLRLIALAGGVALFGIMLLVSVAVFFRYVLNEPILGVQEIVQIGLSVVVMAAMPFTTLKGQHIRVDILDGPLGPVGRFIGDAFTRVVSVFVLYLLIQKTWDKAWDAHEYGDVTNMIEIPVWIAYAAITLGMGLIGVVLAGQLVLQLRQAMTTGVRTYE